MNATLASAFAQSKIDNCNSLLFGFPQDLTSPQQIENEAAWVILCIAISSSISKYLKFLYWLTTNQSLGTTSHKSIVHLYVRSMLHKNNYAVLTLSLAHTTYLILRHTSSYFFTIGLQIVKQHLRAQISNLCV